MVSISQLTQISNPHIIHLKCINFLNHLQVKKSGKKEAKIIVLLDISVYNLVAGILESGNIS